MADDMYDKLMKKMELYRRTHTKVMLPERAALITHQYKLLLFEFTDEVETTYENVDNSISITIKIGSTVTCSDGGCSLNFLIGIANATKIDIIKNQIMFELWYRCWEWIDKA